MIFIHKANKDSLFDTMMYLSDMNVKALRVNSPQTLGVWNKCSSDYALSQDEVWQIYKEFIPKYFEAGMPIRVDLDGFFSCEKGKTEYKVHYAKKTKTKRN